MAGNTGIAPGAVALVTGAATGIGLAVVERLAERGCKVICAGRRLDRLESVAKGLGKGAVALKLDVTDAADCKSLLERLPPAYRAIDILVNNAGHDVGGRKKLDQAEVDDLAAIVETNCIGMIRVTHAVLPAMLKRGSGDIVNLGSTAGLRTYIAGNVYAATKAFVHSFTEGLRMDCKETDVRIIETLPGITRTEFAQARQRSDAAQADAFYGKFPAVMEPDDIARAVVYALEQPRGVTVAQMLVVPTREA
jgi:3-hydroxy acid dehydrogenase / malonic semialdehyde reductase